MFDFDELEEAVEARQEEEEQAAAEKSKARAEQKAKAEAEAAAKAAETARAVQKAKAEAEFEAAANAEAKAKADSERDLVGPRGQSYSEYLDWFVKRMKSGKNRSIAPGRPSNKEGQKVLDMDFEARRELVEQNLAKLKAEGCKSLPPWKKLTKAEIEKVAKSTLKGEMYGLPVPPTLADLEKMGADWLTRAFHAAGTLSKDNSVKRVVEFKRLSCEGQDAAGGAGPKAFLAVEYAKADKDLHTQLFVKLPWAVDGPKELGGDAFYRWKISCNVDNDGQEVTIYRYLGPIFPFRIPKYYFADICRENTNYVLITERIPFGKNDSDTKRKPYELLPVAEKYFDFNLEPRMRYEMYYCIMKAQARMAAWDKIGKFDMVPPDVRGASMAPPAPGNFPFPLQLPAKKRETMKRTGQMCEKLWREYLGDLAKKCYPPEYSDPAFLDAIGKCATETVPYKDDIALYGFLFPEMIALQHPNLQSDNAFYWRRDDGETDCGIIDWGGCAPGHFAHKLQASVTSAEGDVLDEHEDGLIQCFIDEYYRECGIQLNFEEFRRQWWLTYCAYVQQMGTNIEMEIYRCTPRDEWKTIKSLWDDRAAGVWNVRCQSFMIGSALKYLHLRWKRKGGGRLHIHDTFEEWKAFWEANGMS
eukprot:TRINITY_DN63383_c0_g1_i1.p1 TRINITY_DN63383_c0_g1~~TRINITY_DN63383_c0_g1_i1.p1  ORF type:complete len:643 (-),score=157.06 TRINITY_DN63383_c0_g1_i1:176-2104(-)